MKHNHQMVFGRKVDGCPRCEQLKAGAPTVQWRNQRATFDSQRLRDIRAHNCKTAGCGPVCTFGDY